MNKHLIILSLNFLLFAGSFAQQQLYSIIGKGNRAYLNKQYVEAEVFYKKALEMSPENAFASYNLANAVLKQERMDEAFTLYSFAAEKFESKIDKAHAYHNLGNAYVQQQKYKESIEAYKNALKLNPTDEDTRYNLAYAQKKLEQQEEESENQNDENQEEQQNEEEQREDNQNDNNDENKDESNDSEENQGDEQQQKQQPKPQQLTKEQAEQLLKALEAEEEKLQNEKKNENIVPVQITIEKDW